MQWIETVFGLFLSTEKKKKSNQCSEVRMSTMLWMVSISDDNKQTNEVRLVKKRGLTMNSVTYSPRDLQPGMKPSTICGAYSSMWWLIESDVMWIRKKTGYTVYIILLYPINGTLFSSTFPGTDDV